jgi:RHS repeat-associated protein
MVSAASFPAPCAARRAASGRTRPAACSDEPPISRSPATGRKPRPSGRPSAGNRSVPNRTAHPKTTEFQRFGTGVTDYSYRWYDTLTGRWPSRDPIGERGGVNLYGFVGNDGINSVDSDGRMSFPGANPPIDHGFGPGVAPPAPGVFPPASPPPPSYDDIALAICSYSSPASNCECDDRSMVPDPYPERAKQICIDFVKRYQASIAVLSTARCLVKAEDECQKRTCCSDRNNCRLKAHVSCYASRGFFPLFGLPAGGADVGWNMLLNDSQCD